jgi:hypothetical protein
MNIDTCLMLRRWNGERPQISLCTTISLLWSRPAGVVGQVLSAFSDSTVEWRVPTWRVALSYGVGTEEVADTAGTPRAMWMEDPIHSTASCRPLERGYPAGILLGSGMGSIGST